MAIRLLLLLPLLFIGMSPAQPVAQPMAELQAHPFFRTEQYPRWSQMTPQRALRDVHTALEEAARKQAAIAELQPHEITFENTFLACYESDENLRQVQSFLYHISNIASHPTWQRVMNAMGNAIAEHEKSRPNPARIWAVLQQAAAAPFMQEQSPAKQRFARRVLDDMRISGVTLSAEQRARLAKIEQELKQLGYIFNSYAAQGASRWQLLITNQSELHGMPAQWMQQASAAAIAQGSASAENPAWLVTEQSAHQVLSLCTVEETRRKCWIGVHSAGTMHAMADNEPIIARIMELRQEKANLLGFRNYADLQTRTRMMGNAEAALAFVNDMLARSNPAWDAYVAEKLERHSRLYGRPLQQINPWDEVYYDNMLPGRAPAFHAAALTPYLQADRVLDGLMKLWANMLGIRFEELPTACVARGASCPESHVEVWHPQVRAFAVYDAESGAHLGSFYLDLYPRRNKRSQAWCMPLRFGNPAPGGGVGTPHLACLCANLTPPPRQEGHPHLFTHNDLYTLFHEFGHLMHIMLAHGELRAHHAMSVERDFVEFPSHLMETWIWSPEALRTFACHFETGEPMPAHLADMLATGLNHLPIQQHIYMLCSAKLDLEMNMYYDEKFKGRPLDEVSAELLAPWSMPYTQQPPSAMRTMTHCISDGYAANLYTYKWCEVMAADAFERFRREGLLNPAIGAEYRRTILNRGGGVPAAELIRDFLGREPTPEALMRRYQPQSSPTP